MWIFTRLVPATLVRRYWYKRVIVGRCDACGAEFERDFVHVNMNCARFSFCSRRCGMSTVASRPRSEKRRARQSETSKVSASAQWRDADVRSKMVTGMKSAWECDDARRLATGSRMRDFANEFWSDPDRSGRLLEKLRSPEFRAVRSTISKSCQERRWATNRARGQFMQSGPEVACAEFLRTRFGDDAVDRHVRVLGYNIDIHIKTIGVYVEVDGVFFHGLDRPRAKLLDWQRKKFDRDRDADRAFRENGFRLVRITDLGWRSLNTDAKREAWVRRAVIGDRAVWL